MGFRTWKASAVYSVAFQYISNAWGLTNSHYCKRCLFIYFSIVLISFILSVEHVQVVHCVCSLRCVACSNIQKWLRSHMPLLGKAIYFPILRRTRKRNATKLQYCVAIFCILIHLQISQSWSSSIINTVALEMIGRCAQVGRIVIEFRQRTMSREYVEEAKTVCSVSHMEVCVKFTSAFTQQYAVFSLNMIRQLNWFISNQFCGFNGMKTSL